jgi:transcriptional regulator with XRE-family HTH domain
MTSPAQRAREAAGFSLGDAARRARVSPNYLRRIELHGGASYVLAKRLCRIYRCSIHLFLPSSYQRQPERSTASTCKVAHPPS